MTVCKPRTFTNVSHEHTRAGAQHGGQEAVPLLDQHPLIGQEFQMDLPTFLSSQVGELLQHVDI